jgi:hypothetical protein
MNTQPPLMVAFCSTTERPTMRTYKNIAIGALFLICGTSAYAQVQVDGYYRSDGTYVRPHVRSSPDSSRANNYGPSYGQNMMNPYGRDADHDGIANMYDNDDDNDGQNDNSDSSQYGGR